MFFFLLIFKIDFFLFHHSAFDLLVIEHQILFYFIFLFIWLSRSYLIFTLLSNNIVKIF
jgi:hypothetical protein